MSSNIVWDDQYGPVQKNKIYLRQTDNSPEPAAVEANTTPVVSRSEGVASRARNPLKDYSLFGKADELDLSAVKTDPALGTFVMQGQATMIYAAPNTGKTLIMLKLALDAIAEARIDPANFFYINADDSSEGLSVKGRLLQDVGAHMLVPGLEEFRTTDLTALMTQGVANGSARHTHLVIDTVKKFTDLMDKKRTSEFAQACRAYVSAGGTILGLGHTTKNANPDGTPRYQGTTDILEDFDAVYVAQPLAPKSGGNRKVVLFTRHKSRAASPVESAYGYDAEPDFSYPEMLASVQPVDLADLENFATEREVVCDPQLMAAFSELIEAGEVMGMMALAKVAAKVCKVSQRAALDVLQRYTGTTPRVHLWTFDTGPRGVRIYRMIDQTKPES